MHYCASCSQNNIAPLNVKCQFSLGDKLALFHRQQRRHRLAMQNFKALAYLQSLFTLARDDQHFIARLQGTTLASFLLYSTALHLRVIDDSYWIYVKGLKSVYDRQED